MEHNSSTTNKSINNVINIFKSEKIFLRPEFIEAILNSHERKEEDKGFARVLKKEESYEQYQ